MAILVTELICGVICSLNIDHLRIILLDSLQQLPVGMQQTYKATLSAMAEVPSGPDALVDFDNDSLCDFGIVMSSSFVTWAPGLLGFG